jgi:hypothetical protein
MTKEIESSLTVVVKKREPVGDKIPGKVVVTALIEFADI